jgi:hypothetical protein
MRKHLSNSDFFFHTVLAPVISYNDIETEKGHGIDKTNKN